jgi:hypothetical protein
MPPTRTLDDRIDRLYQLPLDEFTAARNALAKEVAAEGGRGDDIRKLTKPPAAAWAINQVYWRKRPVFDAFTASADALHDAHAALAAGKRADLRAAGTAHEEALEAMLKAALAVLAEAGQPATDATKQSIATTLRALPGANERPGRLAAVLQPRGFEMLAGIPMRPGGAAGAKPAAKPWSRAEEPRAKPSAAAPSSAASKKDAKADAAARAKAVAQARETVAEASRVEKAAAQTVRREEFEAARTARDVERADKQLAEARGALDAAQQALEEAEQEATEARRTRDAAARRVREASDALARARVRTETAQAELARAEKR